MSAVYQFFINVYIALAVVPYMVFAGVWVVSYLVWKNKQKSMKLAMDVTTFFLISSVAALVKSVFGFSFILWFIILLMLISFGLAGGYQYRIKGRLDIVKVVRLIWRLTFALFAILYILLLLVELIKHLF
jgi:hypothetical protein